MSFKSWYHNEYKPMNEEIAAEPLDAEAVDQTEMPADKVAHPSQGTGSSFGSYLSANDLTKGLAKLGDDIGKSILSFAIKQFVKPEDFDSKDKYDKYINAMNQKIGLDTNKKLIEVLSNAGVFIENTKRSLSKVG